MDNADLVKELEERFPTALADVPRTKTSRGMHFWFTRPDEADALGYFDGAGQRQVGVDFKSVCSTGTSGIIMVPPSTGKTWGVDKWLGAIGALRPMPLDLLEAVATPRHPGVDLRLEFVDTPDEAVGIKDARCVHDMAYLEPFLSGDLSCDEIPVPCAREPFEQLVAVLDGGSLATDAPTRSMFEAMVETHNMLGGTPEQLRRITSGVPRFQLDWAEIDVDAWVAARRERRWLTEGGTDAAGVLVDVDDKLAGQLQYEPLTKDQRWLFPEHPCGGSTGTQVLYADPADALHDEIDVRCPVLDTLLRRFPGKLVLAGGSVVGSVGRGIVQGNDWDLFLVGVDGPEEADAIVAEVERTISPEKIVSTSRAMTFVVGEDEESETVQVVRRLYANAAQVVHGFDIAACRVAAWWDEARGSLVVRAMPSWVVAMRRMAFSVELDRWSTTTAVRVIKYITKGFDAYVPGLRRAAIKPLSRYATTVDDSFARLLWMESDAKLRFGPGQRLALDDITRYTRKCCTSDYGTMAKLKGSLIYIIRALLKRGRAWFTGDEPPQQPRRWPVFDPRKKNSGIFNPTSPKLYGALSQQLLNQHLAL